MKQQQNCFPAIIVATAVISRYLDLSYRRDSKPRVSGTSRTGPSNEWWTSQLPVSRARHFRIRFMSRAIIPISLYKNIYIYINAIHGIKQIYIHTYVAHMHIKKGVKVTMYTLGLCLEILFRLFVRSMLWSENYDQQKSRDYFWWSETWYINTSRSSNFFNAMLLRCSHLKCCKETLNQNVTSGIQLVLYRWGVVCFLQWQKHLYLVVLTHLKILVKLNHFHRLGLK